MKVTVSSLYRSELFEIARHLERSGNLRKMYTGYPMRKVYEVSHRDVCSHPRLMLVHSGVARYLSPTLARYLRTPMRDEYDRWVARRLEWSDVVAGLHGYSLETFRAARGRGMITVCHHGTAHILTTRELVRQEFRLFGADLRQLDYDWIDNDLSEYEEVNFISVPSTFALKSFLAHGVPLEKLVVHPLGVDLGAFRPAKKRDGTFRVLFVGNISLQKGVQYLLEAVRPLKLPNFELVLVGRIAEDARPVLRRYGSVFRHQGFVPRLNLGQTYSQGSVLVLPSVQDGFGLVMAQAMACGLPVIATHNTGAEDLYTDSVEGFIVEPRDPLALREKILRLYEDAHLRSCMGERALARVREIGGWDRYVESVLSFYRDIAVLSAKSPLREPLRSQLDVDDKTRVHSEDPNQSASKGCP